MYANSGRCFCCASCSSAFPSRRGGFDSLRPLQSLFALQSAQAAGMRRVVLVDLLPERYGSDFPALTQKGENDAIG